MSQNKTVLIAKNLSDILYHIKSVSNLSIVGSCTQLKELPEKSVTTRNVSELCLIEKKERYIDIGAGASISKLLELGQGRIPKILYDALHSIATETIRNVATIGGNVCAKKQKHTLWAPLLALNSLVEIKTPTETKMIPISKFDVNQEKFILTKIRVPLNEFEVEQFRKIGPSKSISPLSASYVFLVDTQRDIIANIKIVYAGKVVFHSPELENKIVGSRLPLSEKLLDTLIEDAKEIFKEKEAQTGTPKILRSQFLNLLRNSLEQLM